jgi:tetratricopeptide (TPR) repeat protein
MIRVKLALACIVAMFLVSVGGVKAQTKNDAIMSFNEGVESMKTDPAKAIKAFEKSITICDQVGDSAKEVRAKAIQVIPDLYLQVAKKLATEKKWTEAIAASKDAVKVSEKYNDEKIKDASQKLLAQCYVIQGGIFYAGKDFDKALKTFDSALYINPNYTKAQYNKALVYMKMENTPKFIEQSNLVTEKAKAEGDTTLANTMTKSTGEYLLRSGIKNMQANKNVEAVSNLEASLKYINNNDVYYYLAITYNKQKKYAEAVTNAKKGLDLETGPADAKAKFYYELATALAGQNKKDEACENFKNANYGKFVTAVKAQLQNLQCK